MVTLRDKMKSSLVSSVLILLSIVNEHVYCAVCPAVEVCENEFNEKMAQIAHDRERVCSELPNVIKCVTQTQCLGDTASYKTNVLRRFQTEETQCNGVSLIPKSYILFLSATAIAWIFSYRNI